MGKKTHWQYIIIWYITIRSIGTDPALKNTKRWIVLCCQTPPWYMAAWTVGYVWAKISTVAYYWKFPQQSFGWGHLNCSSPSVSGCELLLGSAGFWHIRLSGKRPRKAVLLMVNSLILVTFLLTLVTPWPFCVWFLLSLFKYIAIGLERRKNSVQKPISVFLESYVNIVIFLRTQ